MRVLGYARVSTGEQGTNGVSLAAQRDAIANECRRREWTLAETVEDRGVSARTLKRPGLQDLLHQLRARKADALIVSKLDRLSRSVTDFALLMDTARNEGWDLVALDLGVDTTTPTGEAMANVLAKFAQLERRLIGQRTKEALAIKRAEGIKLGRPKAIPVNIQRRISRDRQGGATFAAIATGLNEDGVPTAHGGVRWWPATVRAALHG